MARRDRANLALARDCKFGCVWDTAIDNGSTAVWNNNDGYAGGGGGLLLVQFGLLKTSKVDYSKGEVLEAGSHNSRLFNKEDGGAAPRGRWSTSLVAAGQRRRQRGRGGQRMPG